MKKILLTIATFFNVGKIPLAPGTWASLVTTAVLFLLHPAMDSRMNEIISLILIFFLGIPAAEYAEKFFKKKDPNACVIDEVAGQMLCLIFLPHSLGFYAAAFIIFRFFDILKPFPIHRAEKISGGLGIMIDDLIAGIYTLGILQLYIHLKPLVF